ncbi:MAG: ATP-binding protein [Clostridia bacterium]|nr:ATP-binding protein [Clostridia bacterium]
MDIKTMIDAIPQELSDYSEAGDYMKDGRLYCGKCNTPKTDRMTWGPLEGRIVRHNCKCESEAYKAEQEASERQEYFNKIMRLRNSGFPDAEMSKITFQHDDKSNPKLSEIAHRYVDNFAEMKRQNKGLLLYGSVGTGKTFIAACIANALIEKGYPCLVTNFARIINGVAGTALTEKQEYFDNLNKYDLLVIDDLAAERNTEYVNEIVFNVIDARCRAGKPVIVTTNLTEYEMKHAADIRKQRIYSRLQEMCVPVYVAGRDKRIQMQKDTSADARAMLGV